MNICESCLHKKVCKLTCKGVTECAEFLDQQKVKALPFVAMIEQTLENGKFSKTKSEQKFNGRYAVVYSAPDKWNSPLIDICGKKHYDSTGAVSRMAELIKNDLDTLAKRFDIKPISNKEVTCTLGEEHWI